MNPQESKIIEAIRKEYGSVSKMIAVVENRVSDLKKYHGYEGNGEGKEDVGVDENGLLPCPFCGYKAEINFVGRNGVEIKCPSCVIKYKQKTIRHDTDWLKKRMTETWNKRQPQSPSVSPVAAMSGEEMKKTILKKAMSKKYCSATRFDFLDEDEIPMIYKAMDLYAAQRDETIRELKLLIEKMYFSEYPFPEQAKEDNQEEWQKFKKENNL